MASDQQAIRAMAEHLTAIAQLLLEHVTEQPQQPASLPPFAQVIAPQQYAPQTQPQSNWVCPQHGSSKLVPAGVSMKSGKAKAYDAFIVCDQQGCEQRPGRPAAPERAYPPSQPKQLP